MNTGVYCIRNKLNGKRYVGSSSSSSIKDRWKTHLRALRSGNHHSRHLQAAWDKYGEHRFEWIILRRCSPENCIPTEQKFMDRFRSADGRYGYNVCPRAGSVLGVERSPEFKEKISAYWTGRKRSPEQVEKMRQISTGKRWSDASKKKMSATRRTMKHTEETKRKIGDAHRGMKRSDEAKAKMSACQRGRKLSVETRAKMSAAHKARYARIKEQQA